MENENIPLHELAKEGILRLNAAKNHPNFSKPCLFQEILFQEGRLAEIQEHDTPQAIKEAVALGVQVLLIPRDIWFPNFNHLIEHTLQEAKLPIPLILLSNPSQTW